MAVAAPRGSVTDAVRQAHEAALSQLAAAVTAREKMEARVAALEDLVSTLEAAVDKAVREGPALAELADAELASPNESRVAAVERHLQHSEGSLSPGDLQELLAAEGREETRKNLASALSYLGSSGRASRVGYGRWVAAADEGS